MNPASTQSRPARGQQRRQQPTQSLSIENLRQRLEDHVKSNPMKAVGQAMAVGYILRFLPLRALLSTGLRLAAPVMLLNRIWQAQQSGNGSEQR